MPRLLHPTRLIVAVALGSGMASYALAQADPNQRCWAPSPPYSERTNWYHAEGRFVDDTTVRSTESLVRRFAGTYRLLVVTSEGRPEREVAEYNLTLAPPTRAQDSKIRQIGAVKAGSLQVPLVAVLRYTRAIVGRDSVRD